MAELISAMKLAQQYSGTMLGGEYGRGMLQAAHVLAMDAKNLMDAVDAARRIARGLLADRADMESAEVPCLLAARADVQTVAKPRRSTDDAVLPRWLRPASVELRPASAELRSSSPFIATVRSVHLPSATLQSHFAEATSETGQVTLDLVSAVEVADATKQTVTIACLENGHEERTVHYSSTDLTIGIDSFLLNSDDSDDDDNAMTNIDDGCIGSGITTFNLDYDPLSSEADRCLEAELDSNVSSDDDVNSEPNADPSSACYCTSLSNGLSGVLLAGALVSTSNDLATNDLDLNTHEIGFVPSAGLQYEDIS